MTNEEKQLLLKDLCARLPYEVMLYIAHSVENGSSLQKQHQNNGIEKITEEIILLFRYDELEIKPYLRPMSSMTEDEREEIEVFIFNEWYQEDSCKIDKEGWIEILANYDVSGIDPCFCSDYVDWLNAHHFDYRELIEKGLALEASEDMYKIE